jgi:hypothetical protein
MPTDFGTDLAVDADGDLDIGLRTVSGPRVLAEDLRRRFESNPGSVFYAEGEGFALSSLLHQGMSATDRARAQTRIAAEAERDERVLRARATIDFNEATRTMRITIAVATTGGPFRFVFGVDAATIALLEVT